MKQKKVVFLIVEGFSEETLFHDFFEENYKQNNLKFITIEGDIFIKSGPIKNNVTDAVKKEMRKYKLQKKDIFCVLHVADTDGCFIQTEDIKVSEQEENTIYKLEAIYVNSEKQREKIKQRNELKQRNMKTMNSTSKIYGNSISYRLYYFSRHLEHFLFDKPNLEEDDEKVADITALLEKLKDNDENLASHLLNLTESLNIEELMDYKTSWDYVIDGRNSLNRSSNIHLLFEQFYDDLS